MSWIGDGTCDDGDRGVLFDCADLAWDEGDCDGIDDPDDGTEPVSCDDVQTSRIAIGFRGATPALKGHSCFATNCHRRVVGQAVRRSERSMYTACCMTISSVLRAAGEDPWAELVCGPDEERLDACCYVLDGFEYWEIAVGRPFTVDGHAQLAPFHPAEPLEPKQRLVGHRHDRSPTGAAHPPLGGDRTVRACFGGFLRTLYHAVDGHWGTR